MSYTLLREFADGCERQRPHLDALTATQRLVLLCLCVHADRNTGVAYPSLKRIAAFAGVDVRTARRALHDLEARGFLIRTQRRRGRETNEYRVVAAALTACVTPGESARTPEGGTIRTPPGESTRTPPGSLELPSGQERPGTPGGSALLSVNREPKREPEGTSPAAPPGEMDGRTAISGADRIVAADAATRAFLTELSEWKHQRMNGASGGDGANHVPTDCPASAVAE